jgi:hypothetical protein
MSISGIELSANTNSSLKVSPNLSLGRVLQFCYHTRGAALIEYVNPAHAKLAKDRLQNAPLFRPSTHAAASHDDEGRTLLLTSTSPSVLWCCAERRIEVQYSRFESISLSQSQSSSHAPHRDYTQELQQGIGVVGSASVKLLSQSVDLYSPSSTLCLHDVPSGVTSGDIFKLFVGQLRDQTRAEQDSAHIVSHVLSLCACVDLFRLSRLPADSSH